MRNLPLSECLLSKVVSLLGGNSFSVCHSVGKIILLELFAKRLLVPSTGCRFLGRRLLGRTLIRHPASSTSLLSSLHPTSVRSGKRTLPTFQSTSSISAHYHWTKPAMMMIPQASSENRKDGNEEDDTIITPRDPTTLFNFGPASSRDNIVFTCERPGGDLVHDDSGLSHSSAPTTLIPFQAVEEWAQFMKNDNNRINEVLVLLDDNELECYEEPGLLALYEQYGFIVHRVPMGDPDAPARVLALLSSCYNNDHHDDHHADDTTAPNRRRIVAHCTHGQGRAGRVAAAWLTHQYGLSPEDATTEVLTTALQMGITRMGSPSKLRAWLLTKKETKTKEDSA